MYPTAVMRLKITFVLYILPPSNQFMESSFAVTESLRNYLIYLFKINIRAIPSTTKYCERLYFSKSLRDECKVIAAILARAYLWQSSVISLGQPPLSYSFFTVTLSWKVEEYEKNVTPRANGFNRDLEESLKKRFPPAYDPPSQIIAVPCTVVDAAGRILAWHLPDVICKQRQV